MKFYSIPYINSQVAVIEFPTVLNKLCERPSQYAPAPCKLTFDLLTLKAVSESCVTWPTSMPILVFLGLSVLDLGSTYATDRRQTDVRRQTSDVRRASSLNSPTLGSGHKKVIVASLKTIAYSNRSIVDNYGCLMPYRLQL